MTTKGMTRTTIQLHPDHKERLQKIALSLGYTQTWGKEEGQGSISALMQAIARGEVEAARRNGAKGGRPRKIAHEGREVNDERR